MFAVSHGTAFGRLQAINDSVGREALRAVGKSYEFTQCQRIKCATNFDRSFAFYWKCMHFRWKASESDTTGRRLLQDVVVSGLGVEL